VRDRRVADVRRKEVIMRLIRKLTYVSTGGMIDIRSDAQRIASYSKRLLREHKKTDAPGRGATP
jgi:hypothetical protein